MLAVAVPCKGVPKKTMPEAERRRFLYFSWSRKARSSACDREC